MYRKVLGAVRSCLLFCIKWRYLIALIVFILCVVFKVHGSSINEYNKLFENYDAYSSESLILGKSRPIRSDEWIVHTPYYLSQSYNNYEKSSHMMSLEGQDMIVGYNAPVADITIIAKPFTWGYVLLGNEYGLSWYWCSKMILLILVSFEACMIITRKNKKVALLGTLMTVLAPTVQWWFVPHMVDVFFWGLTLFVLAYHFFVAEGWWRVLFMVLLPLSVITFVLALFPSLQIPIGLTMLALFIACLVRDKNEITFKKRDIWRIVLMAVVVIGVLGYTIWTSKDAIMALYNTVYPGKRVELGGNAGLDVLFTDPTSFLLPFRDITYSNNCEESTFIQFTPIFLMLYPIIWKKLKRTKDMIVGNTLLISIIVMAVFMMIGFPELLAKITTFSYINRMDIAYGLIATLFTIWGINVIWKKQLFSKKQILIVLLIFGFCCICFINKNQLGYATWKYYLIVAIGLMVLGYLMLGGYQKLFLVGMTVLMLISGATVNPVAKGMSALLGHPLQEKIREISAEDSEAYWLAAGNVIIPSMVIANGGRTLNTVNFYPDREKWKLIDTEGKYDDVYNRYAHINTSIKDGDTEIAETFSADLIDLSIGCKDLSKWSVKYILVGGKLKACANDYEEIYDDVESDYYIYKRVEDNVKN